MQEERRSVEVAGRSVDEAIEKALEELQADRSQVEIEILAEGSSGVFGLGAEVAKVRATVSEEESAPPSTDVAGIALEALRNLIDYMGIEAEVFVETHGDEMSPVFLNVTGENLGILIGRQGETLRDLQYITRLIVSRKLQRWANVVVDVEGYRRRRQSTISELAERMAEKVVAEGRAVTLEPMPAHERRIVHMALRDHEFVTTESTGEGGRRKVVIVPKESA